MLKLADVVEIVDSGVVPFKGIRRYVKTGNVNSTVIDATEDVTFDNRPSRANMETQIGDVLCARMKETNKVLVIDTEDKQRCLYSTGFAVLRPNHIARARYLFYYLRSRYFQAMKDKAAHGATQKAINNDDLARIRIPIPSTYSEQDRIVEILDSAERIRSNRAKAQELPRLFVQATFSKLFQQGFTSNNEWDTDTIGNICSEIYRYPTFYGIKYLKQGIPIVRIGNITGYGMLSDKLDEYVFMTESDNSRFPRTILRLHDLVMAVRGDGSAGRIGLVTSRNLEGANISANLMRIQANRDRVHPLYLYYLLSLEQGQALIKTRITRTAKKKITATDFKKIKIPIPPKDLQERFAEIVGPVHRTMKALELSIHAANNLYSALMDRAFSKAFDSQ